MKRRGFLGAMLGIPAIPVAAKAMKELEKFDTPELKPHEKIWAGHNGSDRTCHQEAMSTLCATVMFPSVTNSGIEWK